MMRYLKKKSMLWVLLTFCFLPSKGYCKIIEGSFLQICEDEITLEWNKKEWRTEFAYMKDIGMDKLIIQWTAFADGMSDTDSIYVYMPNYPTAQRPYFRTIDKLVELGNKDILDTILSVCDSMGFEVYMGTLTQRGKFKYWDVDTTLKPYVARSIELIKELESKYSHHSSFVGWHIAQEFSNWGGGDATWRISDNIGKVSRHWRIITDICHTLTDKPVMISPYFSIWEYDSLGVEVWHENYDSFRIWLDSLAYLSGIDILVMQDGVGAHHFGTVHDSVSNCPVDSVPVYFQIIKDICDCHNVAFWPDLEIYEQIKIVPGFVATASDIDRVITQMDNESPYAEKIMCFEFNHYMSPVKTIKSWENIEYRLMAPKLYDDYKDSLWNIKNLAYNSTYTLNPEPDSQDASGYELIDTTISFDWRDYVGWLNVNSIAVKIDLGSVDTIRNVRAYFLQDASSAIYLPTEVKILVSENGTNYSFVGTADGFRLDESIDAIVPFSWIDSVYTGRWVKLVISPGGAWTFLSEVQVFGTSE